MPIFSCFYRTDFLEILCKCIVVMYDIVICGLLTINGRVESVLPFIWVSVQFLGELNKHVCVVEAL